MSILIKGMEMPKNCDECFFVGRGFPDWCSLPQIPKDEDEIDDTNNRPDWCPLEEVPSAQPEPCEDTISRKAAIDALAIGEELLKRVLDDVDVVGNEREKYEWGLGLIESYIADMKDLPSAQPDNSCDGCRYENANDGVLVPCGFCKRSHPDNYERRTDE